MKAVSKTNYTVAYLPLEINCYLGLTLWKTFVLARARTKIITSIKRTLLELAFRSIKLLFQILLHIQLFNFEHFFRTFKCFRVPRFRINKTHA